MPYLFLTVQCDTLHFFVAIILSEFGVIFKVASKFISLNKNAVSFVVHYRKLPQCIPKNKNIW